MLGDNFVNCKKLFEDCPEVVEVECVGTVGLGVRRVVVDLEEDAVYPCGNRCADEDGDELGLAA